MSEVDAMDKIILKPTKSKIVVSWLIMSFVILIFTIFNLKPFTDFALFAIVVLVILFQALIFMIIFYNLPYFKIEVNDSYLIGPRSLGGGWKRAKIAIAEIDLQNINSTFQWLGFYIIKSTDGEKISIWGFDEIQFRRLIDLLEDRKRA
jgi:hypothetical protein